MLLRIFLNIFLSIILLSSCTSNRPQAAKSNKNVARNISSSFLGNCWNQLAKFWRVPLAKNGEFSSDFKQWLQQNNYSELLRKKKRWSSFGGLRNAEAKIKRIPTIFIHGNSDSALGYSLAKGRNLEKKFSGWREYRDYFHSKGLSDGEMYAITVGDVDENLAALQVHNYESIMRVRMLIYAVSEYSKDRGNPSGKVNIVMHSMGNTLGLRAILGGAAFDLKGIEARPLREYSVIELSRHTKNLDLPDGNSMSIGHLVNTMVGIAGATRGLDACKGPAALLIPTCQGLMGLKPNSRMVDRIWDEDFKPADNVYSIYSRSDEILGSSNDKDRAEGISSRLPQTIDEFVFEDEDHFEVKDKHADLVFKLLYSNNH